MAAFNVYLILLTTAYASCAPKESTHELLSRLGFDPVQKPGVNFHKKRVVDESDKARHSPSSYNSDTDSNLFVVRLPPHHPFYSDVHPEKFENEVTAKRPMNFPSNGKPSQVYHWNIPLMNKLAKHKKNRHDSKIVHLKILPEQKEEYKFYQKLKKEGKPNIYKLKRKDHVMSFKDLAQNDRPMRDEQHKPVAKSRGSDTHHHTDSKLTHTVTNTHQKDSKLTHILTNPHHKDSKLTHIVTNPKQNYWKKPDKSESKIHKYSSNKENQVLKYIGELGKDPKIYSPAIPKHNSFFKYFPGNGKPKSFYVIEKGENPTRFHRLM